MRQQNRITQEHVSALERAMNTAGDLYRKAALVRKTRERNRDEWEHRRILLVKRQAETEDALQLATSRAVEAAIENKSFAKAATTAASVRNQFRLQSEALRHLEVMLIPQAEKAALVAKIAEKEAEADYERARLEHHEANALLLMRNTALLNGGIQSYSLGGAAEKMRNRLLQLWRELDVLRNVLHKHDQLVAKQRQSAQNTAPGRSVSNLKLEAAQIP